MWKKNKNPNRINKQEAIEILQAYGFYVEQKNFYQFRIRPEETQKIYDWYHTTGTLTCVFNGFTRKINIIKDPEEVAEFIKKETLK